MSTLRGVDIIIYLGLALQIYAGFILVHHHLDRIESKLDKLLAQK